MATIYITQVDNDHHFNQKLSTWRNGFCRIERKVVEEPDPNEIWDFYGKIKTPAGMVVVTSGDGKEWEIL